MRKVERVATRAASVKEARSQSSSSDRDVYSSARYKATEDAKTTRQERVREK